MERIRTNKENILEVLEDNGASSRSFIHLLTDIPMSTIYDVLHNLEKCGKVERVTYNNNQVGRPITLWRFTL